ncbi:CRC domain-containing protein TSO1-like isoform X2 [Telopea speciosissima]|uniref:CRC domain-containing protein TSO1-like isoform X2 n=1 Tax=Telopea speciosissima TaxID=54955 RepID=UPI001CC3D510|nr:CRC domain-containing protein TSO1-like isoform X2 [Telopea speciosissima]
MDMDTPERNQIGTPISKFEDSPVFNYINSLSPIQPVKSMHIAQTFNSLTFAPLPSVFTSPHAISHKESRFLRRHHLSDLSKPDFSGNGNEGNTSVGVLDSVQLPDCSAPQESFDPGSSIKEVTESSNLAIELPRNMKYDCGSPDCIPMPSDGIKMDPLPEITATPASLVRFVQEVSDERRHSFESKLEVQEICQVDHNRDEGTECDWEHLISDAADLLILDASIDAGAPKKRNLELVHHETGSFASLVSNLPECNSDDLQKTQPVGLVDSCEKHEIEDPVSHPEEVRKQKEMDNILQASSSTFSSEQVISGPSEGMDEKVENCISVGGKHQRGMRRRCLVFEMAGAQKKNLGDDSKSSSSVSSLSDVKDSDDKQLVHFKPGNSSSPCMLPGIGLHLNALASTSKDCRVVKHETLASGRQLISMRSSITSFHSFTSGQITLTKSLALNSMEKEIGPADNGSLVIQDASQASTFGASEEFNPSSPKKKRRKLENVGESEACKRCNCKKSKCLKLYCECFAAGVYCVEPCSCQECFNKPIHEDTVLATRKQIESRNPLAFAPKVIRSSEPVVEVGDDSNKTPASARHKRGCNCKKSSCLKKYCECYQGGVGCSINCRCEGCKNTFGRKDGSALVETEEAEQEEEETETYEKNGAYGSVQNNEVQKDEEQYSDCVLPITPSVQICRSSFPPPRSSSGKPPRSILGTSQLHSCQKLGKSDFIQPRSKFERDFETILKDETPEILRGDCSPIGGIKTASPNRKRVSPPHNEFGMSPGRRSGRKLILQSIPSFPSLTPHHETSEFPLRFE